MSRIYIVIFVLLNLSGCTVLGMLADGRLHNKSKEQQPPHTPTDNSAVYHEDSAAMVGLATDIAIIKKLKQALSVTPEEPAKYCEEKNGIEYCYLEQDKRQR